MTKLNGIKNAIMQLIYVFNGPMFNLFIFCHIILNRDKVTSYEKNSAAILPFKSKLSGKFQRFSATDGSIEMLKNS